MKQLALISIFFLIGCLFLSGLFLVFVKETQQQSIALDDRAAHLVSMLYSTEFSSDEQYETAKKARVYLEKLVKKDPYNTALWVRLFRLHKDIARYEGRDDMSLSNLAFKIARQLNPDLQMPRDFRPMVEPDIESDAP